MLNHRSCGDGGGGGASHNAASSHHQSHHPTKRQQEKLVWERKFQSIFSTMESFVSATQTEYLIPKEREYVLHREQELQACQQCMIREGKHLISATPKIMHINFVL